MGNLRAGLAEVVITPPVGGPLYGYGHRKAGSTGVLDDLWAKAVVLSSDGARIGIVACDLGKVDSDLGAAVRSRVREDTGIVPEALMIAATHTHSGPDPDRMSDADLDDLAARIAGAVRAAAHGMREATVAFAAGSVDAGANRRYAGSPYGPYFLYNDPAGTIDPTVQVMVLRSPEGDPLGAVVGYACHPVTLGPDELGISKDYVHFTCETLKQAWGTAAVAMFLQGCAGNINPRWIWDRPELEHPPKRVFPADLETRLRETRRLGRAVGGEALKAAESVMRPEAGLELGARSARVELPVRKDLGSAAAEAVEKAGADHAGRRYRTIYHALARGARSYALEIQVLKVGNAFVVGLPGEIFVEHQISIRRKLAGHPVHVVGLANDCVDYVPTAQAFREGGYEPLWAFFEADAGERLVETALELAKDL